MRILVAEDNEDSRVLLETILGGRGYEVLSAGNGKAALALARETPPDLVISDILMPEMDGYGLCRTLQQDPALRRIPFFFYTATYTDPKDKAYALSLGARAFFLKPEENAEMLTAISSFLDASQEGSPAPEIPQDEVELERGYSQVLFRKLNQTIVRLCADQARLQASERNYRELFDNAPVGIFQSSREGVYLMVNRAYARMCGYDSPGEMLSRVGGLGSHFGGDPEHQKLLLAALGSATDQVNTECLLLRENGSPFWANLLLGVLPSSEGGALQGIVVDVTLRKETELALNRTKEAAEQASKLKTSFLANMSHEIRTPLNGIVGSLQILKNGLAEEDRREIIDIALQASGRLATLLGDILDISCLESGSMQLQEGAFHVNDVLMFFEKLYHAEALTSGVTFSVTLDPSCPGLLYGDERRLRQILFNLVGNALKFTAEGTVRLEVHVLPVASMTRRWVLFTVSDTGTGIDDGIGDVIFDIFRQGNLDGHSRRYQGAGLGLSIVKRLAGLMGGSICFESAGGEGTTFYVSLPFRPVCEPSGTVTLPDETPELRGPLRVLLVEDDAVNRIAMSRLLEREGFTVQTVGSGEKALVRLGQETYDLILMDIQLPGMSGVETTRSIRNGRAGPDCKGIPIIAVTAYALNGDRDRLLGAGMDGYVTKPLDFQLLLGTMERILRTSLRRSA